MRLRWTVLTTVGAEPLDLLVSAPRGATLAQVWAAATAGQLPEETVAGLTERHCRVGGALVSAGHVVGTFPLLDGAVLVLGAGADEPPPPGRGPGVRLVSVAGPDAGRTHHLRPGTLTIGRAPGCDVVLADPDVSRVHGSLHVSPDGVTVLDAGSTNGTWVRPEPGSPPAAVGTADPPRLLLGSDVRVGGTTLRAEAGYEPTRAQRDETGRGTLEVPRPPRRRLPERTDVVRLPPAPPARRPRGVPWLAALLPLVAAGVLAAVTGSVLFLLLAVLGPVLVAANALTDRREHRSDSARAHAEHQRASDDARSAARTAARLLADARRDALPDAATVLRRAGGADTRLWERSAEDDDVLRVRVGTTSPCADGERLPPGTGPADVVLEHPDGSRERVVADDDVVALDLAAGPAAVVEQRPGDGLARFVVGQVCAAVSPEDLVLVALLPDPDAGTAWRWLRWLPHTRGAPDGRPPGGHGAGAPGVVVGPGAVRTAVAELAARVAERRGRRHGDAARPTVLVLLDGPPALPEGCSVDPLARAADVGVHLLTVARDAAHLPAGCRSVVLPAGETGTSLQLHVTGTPTRTAVADRVGAWWAERLARSLAPLRPAARAAGATSAARSLPATVPLGDLLDLDPARTAERWARAGDGLAVPLGVDAGGTVELDLVAHGPHALVAGTTGSGKSELLRTWVSAMAASVPPEKLTFLLVDYKGGAAFGSCARLPHTVQLLTDLDGAATTRVLQSLRAEIRRREHLLAAHGARDLAGYRALDRPDGPEGAAGRRQRRPPVPRLVVVVDEFRVLAEEAPDVLGELVNVAATGRSLGIHLVLATQRPGGVVSADIRANASLRVALRVREAAESVDVVDRPDAADLPSDRPGRAVVAGAGIDTVVQTALTAAPRGPAEAVRVVPWPWEPRCGGPAARVHPAAAEPAEPEVVTSVLEAARLTGRTDAEAPWLPPLPAHVERPAAGLPEVADLADLRPGPGPSLLVACADLPWLQRRSGLHWRPATDGPVLVVGGPRTGRSTTLAAFGSAALAAGLGVVHVAGGLDPQPSARPGEEAAGATRLVVDAADADHVGDVLRDLLTRARAAGPGTGPGLVLCVDDVDTLLDPSADPDVPDVLAALVREGGRARVWPVLAGGRALAASRMAAGVRLRLAHRPADPADATLLGVDRRRVPSAMPPGRVLAAGWELGEGAPQAGGTAVQAQVLTTTACGSPRSDPGRTEQASTVPPGAVLGLPRALPSLLGLGELPEPTWPLLPVGLSGPDAAAAVLDLSAAGLVAVVGPPGSGRSTALAVLAEQARRAGARVVADLADLADPAAVAVPAGPTLLLVDDLDRCPADTVERVEDLLEQPVPGLAVAVASTPDHLASGFRGIPAHVRLHGSGVLLQPGRTDGRDVLGLRGAPRQLSRLPGRGLLVTRGRASRLHLAVPTDHPDG